ncbi:hypothetical protein ABPG74_019719 [Tetrahymena malaccensis]
MLKRGRIIYSIFLFLVFSFNVKTQITNKQKYLILQKNETYISNLNEFVSEPIIDINLASITSAYIIEPYQQLQIYRELPTQINNLASINNGDSSKSIISVKQQFVSPSIIQIYFVYQQFSIDSECSCLKQVAQIEQKLDSTSQKTQYFYASFYSNSKGLISYTTIDNQTKSFRFQIKSYDQIEINIIDNIQVFRHISIQGPCDSIYIIQATVGEYQLIKLDTELKLVFLKKVIDLCQFENFLIDSGRYIFKYCSSNSSTIIKAVSVDFTNENLVFQIINLSHLSKLSVDQLLIKRMGIHLMIGVVTNKDITIIKFTSYDSIIKQTIQQQQITQIKSEQFQNIMVEFISLKLMVVFFDNLLYLYDIDNQIALYKKEVCEKGFKIKFIHNIRNKILLHIYDSNNKYSNTISAQINIPQVVIQIASPTNQHIEIFIQTESKTTYQIQLIPMIVEQNQIFFSQENIILQKAIQNYQVTDYHIIPIEDYIQGSDVHLIASVNSNRNEISNYQIAKYFEIQHLNQFIIDDSCKCYQTEGYFSSIFLCPANLPNIGQVYQIYAVKTLDFLQISQFNRGIQAWKSQAWIQQQIGQIDNHGSFTLKIDKNVSEFSIFIPFLHFSDTEQLYLNQIQVSCSELNFQFATDPANSILFILCGEKISQQIFRFQNDKFAQIIKTSEIPYNFQKISNLICIQGILFIYNSSKIIAYDYINQGFLGEINVPTVIQGKSQKITLFLSSFLITVIDEPLKIITQYSYNNFQSKTPSFMRNLQIDSHYLVNIYGEIIPKRYFNQEFAYIQSTQKNVYYLYRINSKQWSNQLYTTLLFNPKQTIIGPNLLYSIKSQSSILILKEVSVLYQLNKSLDEFSKSLQFISQLSISVGKQKDTKNIKDLIITRSKRMLIQNKSQLQYQAIKQLQITIYTNRDASAQFAIIDLEKQSIKQFIYKISNKQKDENKEESFSDTQIVNNCILGWESDQFSQVTNKLILNDQIERIINTTFYILYNLHAIIKPDEVLINGSIQIMGLFNDCIVLDDKASFQKIYKYKIQFETTDINSGYIQNSQVLQGDIYNLDQPEIQISIFNRIISYQGKMYVYQYDSMQAHQLKLNYQYKEATILKQDRNFQPQISIHAINQYQTIILIYRSGLIQMSNRYSDAIIIYNIQDLLKQFGFIVQKEDYIYQIQQYQDTQFLIAFRNSYIYDVTFSMNPNQQLEIVKAYQYYYLDAFTYFIQGIKFDKYTIFIGYNYHKTQQIYTLYSNQEQQSNIYLIQSTLIQDLKGNINFLQYFYQMRPYIFIQLSNSQKQVLLTIQDEISVKINQFNVNNTFSQTLTTSLSLKGQSNPHNLITFSYVQYGLYGEDDFDDDRSFTCSQILKIKQFLLLFVWFLV